MCTGEDKEKLSVNCWWECKIVQLPWQFGDPSES